MNIKYSSKTGLFLSELALIIVCFLGGLVDAAGEEGNNPNKDKSDFGGYVEEVKYEKIDTVIKYKKELSPAEVEEIKKESSMDLLRDEENNITGIRSLSKESLQEFLKKNETPEMTKQRNQEEALKEIMSDSKGISSLKNLNNEPEEKQATKAEKDIPSDDEKTIEGDKDKGRSRRLIAITAISGTAAAGALVAALLSNSGENNNDDDSGSLITDKPPLPPE